MHAVERRIGAHLYRRSDTSSFYVHYTMDGKRYRKKVRCSRKKAELLRNELELKLLKSQYIFSPKKAILKSFAQDYLKYVEATKAAKTLKGGYSYKVTAFVEYCSKLKPTQVKPNNVNNFMLSRLKEVEPVTVASDLRTVRAWFNKASPVAGAFGCKNHNDLRPPLNEPGGQAHRGTDATARQNQMFSDICSRIMD